MRTRNSKSAEITLESVQTRFDHWRKTRQKREAIPDELWSAAVLLTEEFGLYQVSKQLKLNHTSLKKRVGLPSSKNYPTIKSSSFIEIPVVATGNSEPCQVDIRRKDGSQMQIRLFHGNGTDLSALVRAFTG